MAIDIHPDVIRHAHERGISPQQAHEHVKAFASHMRGSASDEAKYRSAIRMLTAQKRPAKEGN